MNRQILYQSKKIYCRIYGSGKPVLLIHGFGETGEVWKNQIEFLKDKCKLIIPDLPGSGLSEMIDDMSMEGMAEVIKEIIIAESPKVPLRATVYPHLFAGTSHHRSDKIFQVL
jgi:pimeloyl-ACP methyl ester carboxylesterase